MSQLNTEQDQLFKLDRNRKLLRIRNVIAVTGISKSYIYDLCKKGLFPKPIELVPGGTSVAWVQSEVQDWIDTRIKARDRAV